ncbi:hypothetical protein BJY24_001717 [Nocardia transvalensis]|uniref:Excreted virulence factor EspC (Type VII ESX diderm) n=1 Tax=Nocardia transvalensis TaxID=37333 RepID=A0A7W9PBD9_9NOCA|nr:type VII secretion target [Nocardia transvalensis]MBB5912850.1 hypothetical protein [Nocardia transvalensis]
MGEFVATPDAIRDYGNAAATMATGVGTAGAFDQTATIAAVVPVFGLLGQEFLMSFAYAQANHAASVAELAGVHAATALTAHDAAAAYESTEHDSVSTFDAAKRSV